jgi:aminoglycoside phosphotransferase (APT) family kinase protein
VSDTPPIELALAAWVGGRLAEDGLRGAGSGAVTCHLHGPVPTGNSNVTMPFTARWGDGDAEQMELVLRMQVPANQIFLDADVLREFRVLDALARLGTVPVPRPRWAEADDAVLGHPFFVMDKVAGTVPTGTPTIHADGWLAARSPAAVTIAWDSALAALGAVSMLDWRTHVPFLGEASNGTTLATRLEHLGEWYRWSVGDREFPVTDAALAWLQAEMPAVTGEPVLCWGDARLGNTMFREDGSVAALLDWELASIGPAGIDLGWWLAFDEFTTHAHGVEPLAGYPGRGATIERYESLTGHHVAQVEWYEVFCAWVLTVTVIRMADIAVAAGRLAADNRMGHGNLTAQMIARRLDLPVPDLDPDYAARRGLPTRARQ